MFSRGSRSGGLGGRERSQGVSVEGEVGGSDGSRGRGGPGGEAQEYNTHPCDNGNVLFCAVQSGGHQPHVAMER